MARAPLPPGAEAISFLGDTLMPPEQPEEVRAVYMDRYREAEEALQAAPEDVDALIWMGRRTAYLGRYRESIDIYTRALALHPDDARLYRHRGHRYLSVREPEHAILDFERAAQLTEGLPDEVEPDGLPNAMNTPTSTLQFNIFYHLALAHYVQGHLEEALDAQRSCLEASAHPDSVVATSYWMYMTLRRLGMDDEAQEVLDGITADMEIIESSGVPGPAAPLQGGADARGPRGASVGMRRRSRARRRRMGSASGTCSMERTAEAHDTVWEGLLMGRNQWSAFGYLSAEGELARSALR